MRVTEIFWGGKWVEVDFRSIKQGDVFRMFEPDGTPVKDQGAKVFIAKDDAYYSLDWETHMVDYDKFYGM